MEEGADTQNDAPTMVIPPIPPQDEESYDQPTAVIPELPKEEISAPTEEPPQEDQPKKAGRLGMILGIVAGSLLLALVLGVMIYGFVLKADETIYPNVYVAGIHVGGMDRQSAIDAVDEVIASSYASSTLHVELPDRTLSFTPDKTNVALDANEAIDAAMAYGRSGNPFSAVTNYYASRSREHYVDLQTVLDLDTAYIRSALEDVAAEVETVPSPSTASFDEKGKRLTIQVGYPDRSLDVEGLYEVVYTAFINSDFTPVQWEYDEIPTEHMDLTPYFEQYCTPVQDAYYDEENHVLVESVPGYGFDMEDVAQKLDEAEPGSKLVIPMADLTPKVTTDVVADEMFGTELFSFSSEYVVNANRTKNLTLACQAVNGIILNPGDVFSFNNVVGERTAAKGYLPATVYNAGQSVEELGGGVCQVASTLYYCTLHLNLEQVHREPHVYVVTYVPKGMDATVYWGHIDYQFRNTLDFPIRILANTDNGHVNITFQGAEELDFSVKMESTILETYPWQEVEELDETKEPGYRQVDVTPYTGYRVVTHKTIYDADGKELSREQEALSVYSKRDQKVIVGPPEEEVPEDPFDPDLWNPPTDDDDEQTDPPADGEEETTPPDESNDPITSPWPDGEDTGNDLPDEDL